MGTWRAHEGSAWTIRWTDAVGAVRGDTGRDGCDGVPRGDGGAVRLSCRGRLAAMARPGPGCGGHDVRRPGHVARKPGAAVERRGGTGLRDAVAGGQPRVPVLASGRGRSDERPRRLHG